MTGSDGKFTVTTLRPDDGIYPGKYKVTIVKYEEYGPEPNAVLGDYGEMVQPSRPQKNVLPVKYENTTTSGIAITVEKGRSVPLEINLVD